MRTLVFSAVAAFSLAAPTLAQYAPQQLYEARTGATPLNAVIKHRDNAGHGLPAAIRVDVNGDGVLGANDRVHLYTTGIENFAAPETHDMVYLWRNPNTYQGWNSEYTLFPKLQILPQSGSSCVGCEKNVNYANQWPYMWGGKILMVTALGRNPGPTQTHDWHEMLLGSSSDGVAFTWMRFLKMPQAWNLNRITWQPVTIGGETRFWGFVEQEDRRVAGGTRGLGGIRFRHTTGTEPHFVGNDGLEVFSGGAWRAVPTCASIGDTSGYKFCLYTNASDPNGSVLAPDFFALFEAYANFHALSRHGGRLELWTSGTDNATDPTSDCDRDGSLNEWMNAFLYRSVATPTSLSANPSQLLGERKVLRQLPTNPVRHNPAGYPHSRKGAFRLDWTLDILYTRTWDDPFDPFSCLTQPPEGYIVRTFLGLS